MMVRLIGSKNRKLVKRWKKEHQQLVVLGKKVLAEYVKNDQKKIRSTLRTFTDLAMEHLTSEDIELYKLMNNPLKRDKKLEESIEHFQSSFKEIKTDLMKFLAAYSREEQPIDQEFFDTFSRIVEILAERIKYEESELYFYLSMK